MNELRAYLLRNEIGDFQPSELNYVLLITYNVLKWTVRDHADTLCLNTTEFMWSKQGAPIGTFRIDDIKPTMSFREALQTIVARDPIVQHHMELVTESPQELTYRIHDTPVTRAA